MFFFTLNHYIYCKNNNINFKLDTNNWLFKYKKGWDDYFKNIDINNCNNYDNIKYTKHEDILDNYSIKEYKDIISQVYIYNDITINKINEIKCNLGLFDKDYDSIFIRRGDKLISESEYIHAENYIKILLDKNPNCKKIFLQTDDYNCYLELEDYIKNNNLNIKLLTLCDKNTKGFVVFNYHLNNIINSISNNISNKNYLESNNELKLSKTVYDMDKNEIYNHTINMIIGIDIVSKSNICITDYKSNVGRFIKLLHKNSDNVYNILNLNNDIDYSKNHCPAWEW